MNIYDRFKLNKIVQCKYASKMSLKIPKGKSESVNRRRTDNTMAKRRRTDSTMAKRRRTDNTMAKRRRTDNTMAKRRRTDNTMAKKEGQRDK